MKSNTGVIRCWEDRLREVQMPRGNPMIMDSNVAVNTIAIVSTLASQYPRLSINKQPKKVSNAMDNRLAQKTSTVNTRAVIIDGRIINADWKKDTVGSINSVIMANNGAKCTWSQSTI